MLNVYDVIAIGVVSLALMFIVRSILDFIQANSARKTFREAMKNGIIHPMNRDEMKKAMKEANKRKDESTSE